MLTSTDYIGIGVLITTVASGVVQIVSAFRIKDVHDLVNSNSSAQNTLIAALRARLEDKDHQLSDNKQIAAVLAAGQHVSVPNKLEEIAINTKETVEQLKK